MKNNSENAFKVAIILPVYNVEDYLEECLDSILDQSYTSFELFAINGESTDKSLAILDEYAQNDKRIPIISTDNEGLAVARNHGLDAAKSLSTIKYISFIDSDDKVAPDYLTTLVY